MSFLYFLLKELTYLLSYEM